MRAKSAKTNLDEGCGAKMYSQAAKGSEPIDMQKIIEEIKTEIAEKGLKAKIPDFWDVVDIKTARASISGVSGLDIEAFRKAVSASKSIQVHAYNDLGKAGRAKLLVKRLIRRLIFFAVAPIVEAINEKFVRIERIVENLGVYAINSFEKGELPSTAETLLLEQKKILQGLERQKLLIMHLEKEVSALRKDGKQTEAIL
jgi:hypothetical protein